MCFDLYKSAIVLGNGPSSSDPAKWAAYLAKFTPLLEKLNSGFQTLARSAPPTDEVTIQNMAADLDRSTRGIESAKAAADQGNARTLQAALKEAGAAIDSFSASAMAQGMGRCADVASA